MIQRTIIPGQLIVTNDGCKVIDFDINTVKSLDNIDTFITQNPYFETDIKNWDKIHANGDNITVGVFGKTSDNDKKDKLEELFYLRNELSTYFGKNEIVAEYVTVGDTYLYVIGSQRKEKEKILVKTR